MRVEIPAYKHIEIAQHIDFNDSNICALIGGNGSGKSTILESIFSNYIDKENSQREQEESLRDAYRCIVFSSGQNELFSKIFNDYERNLNRYRSYGNDVVRSFYFDYGWSKLLIFFATSLKPTGLVRKYLVEHNYIDVADNKDNSTFVRIGLRVRKPLVDRVINDHSREERGEFVENSLIRSLYLRYLEKIIQAKIDTEYSFRDKESINRIVSTNIHIKASEAKLIFNDNPDEIFTFFARATGTWLSNVQLDEVALSFKNSLELRQLSDGEYQLLSIYALIDLFDGENTVFLLDEVDSHLHYENIKKLWDNLSNLSGRVLTTTHLIDSILQNKIESIKVVKDTTILNTSFQSLLDRLDIISSNKTYQFKIAASLKNIVLVENYTDWFIFIELCKVKIIDYDRDLLSSIHYINCSAGYDSHSALFGNKKIFWFSSYKDQITASENKIKNIFMLCDRDTLPLASINTNLTVTLTEEHKRLLVNRLNIKPYLMSWKRKQIENYLISKTMNQEYGILESILDKLPRAFEMQSVLPMDCNEIRELEIKREVQQLYCEDGAGINYDKLREVISKIPPEEISDDVVLMYNFIKDKVERNN